jgi:hypothetical protein
MKILLFFILLLTVSAQAKACIGPPAHSAVFFEALPVESLDREYVFLIEILKDRKQTDPSKIVTVKVLNKKKGKKDFKKIDISIPLHTCYGGRDLEKGQKFFVSGSFKSNNWYEFGKIFNAEMKSMDIKSPLFFF